MARLVTPLAMLAACLVSPFALSGQAGTAVRGRILDSTRVGLPAVEVVIVAQNESRTVTTRADGSFLAYFPEGPQSFFLMARRIGFHPVSWTAQIEGQRQVVVTDTVLRPSLFALPAILVQSTGGAVGARPSLPSPLAGLERALSLSKLIMTVDGDLEEAMRRLPRSALSDSALGSVLLDGMSFSGSRLPPDAIAGARITSTSSDVGAGNVDGEQMQLVSAQGTGRPEATVRVFGSAPWLAWADPLDAAKPRRQFQTTGFVAGPIPGTALRTHLSWNATLSSRPALSLFGLSPENRLRLGITDSALTSLQEAMRQVGLGTTLRSRSELTQRQVTLAWNLTTPLGSRSSAILSLIPSWGETDGLVGSLASPGTARRLTSGNHAASLRLSSLLGMGVSDLRSAVSLDRSTIGGLIDLPGARVQLNTMAEDGVTGLTTVTVGGAGGRTARQSTRWETRHTLSWVPGNGTHRLEAGQAMTWAWRTPSNASDAQGTFSFLGTEQLAANTPSAYTRALDATPVRTAAGVLSLWGRDTWRVSSRVGMELGVRWDRHLVGAAPTRDTLIEAAFGRRTDQRVAFGSVAPRLGVVWLVKTKPFDRDFPTRRVEGTNLVLGSPLGVGGGSSDGGVVRVGGRNGYRLAATIGAYPTTTPADRLAELLGQSGATGSGSLQCAGPATPVPSWQEADPPPTLCADGSSAGGITRLTPRHQLVASDYTAKLTWKASLSLSGLTVGSWRVEPSVLLAATTHRDDAVDLNLQTDPRFQLAAEGGRPVFVPVDAIDPQSGIAGQRAQRRHAGLGEVWEQRSDLRSRSAQFDLVARTEKFIGPFPLEVQYRLFSQQAEARNDPYAPQGIRWQRSPVTHQFVVGSHGFRLWWFTLGAAWRLSSGARYTPMVATDINGNGRADDPAFIPGSAMTQADPALAQQLDALLQSTSSMAASCLRNQAGQLAAIGSCGTGWQTQFDFRLQLDPPSTVPLSRRLRAELRLENAGGAVARLLGLSEEAFGSTRINAAPDQRLFHVTGFDPVTRTYQYQVNQLFGRFHQQGEQRGGGRTFQVHLGLSYQFGGGAGVRNAMAQRYQAATGGLLPDSVLTQRLIAETFINPADTLLALRDSLALSPEQVVEFTKLRDEFAATARLLIAPLVRFVTREGLGMRDEEFYIHSNAARLAGLEMSTQMQERIESLLTAEQRARIFARAQRRGLSGNP